MLMPKRVKRRKVSRGRMKGKANKGNKIAYGEIALVAEECGWVTSNQIEAARIAMTRFTKSNIIQYSHQHSLFLFLKYIVSFNTNLHF